MHEEELQLVLSDPPPDTLPRPEPKCQGAKPRPVSSPALLSAAAPSRGVEAQWVLKHLCTPAQRVKTSLDHRLRGELSNPKVSCSTECTQMCLCADKRTNSPQQVRDNSGERCLWLDNAAPWFLQDITWQNNTENTHTFTWIDFWLTVNASNSGLLVINSHFRSLRGGVCWWDNLRWTLTLRQLLLRSEMISLHDMLLIWWKKWDFLL